MLFRMIWRWASTWWKDEATTSCYVDDACWPSLYLVTTATAHLIWMTWLKTMTASRTGCAHYVILIFQHSWKSSTNLPLRFVLSRTLGTWFEFIKHLEYVCVRRAFGVMTIEFLMYHVVNGSYFSQDLRDGQQLSSMLNGRPIQVGIRVDGCSRKYS